jgi:hypothetical protein
VIYATDAVVRHAETEALLAQAGISPIPERAALRGISDDQQVYTIP